MNKSSELSTLLKVVMSRLAYYKGLYEWSFNDGTIGFFYISIVTNDP